MPTPLTTSDQVAAAETATTSPVADLLTATQQLVNFQIPAEDLQTAAHGSTTLGVINKLFAPLLADIAALPGKIAALATMLEKLLPSGQTLDHLTMTLSASSVVETAIAPTLTLGQWQTSDSSTPYTDTLSPANAFSSSAPSVATIDATSGAITIHGPGTVTFTRTAGGKTVTATLTVTAEVLSSTPSSLSVTIGAGPSAALVIKDQNGVNVTSACTFASSNTGVATVSSSGVVTYVGAGTCNIVATHTVDNETCTIGVTVSAAPAPPVFTSITPNTITQNTSGTYAIVGDRLNSSDFLANLPPGLSAGAFTVTDPQHASVTLTATGAATLGAASIKITDPSNGDSGSLSFAVNSGTPNGAARSVFLLDAQSPDLHPTASLSSTLPLAHTNGTVAWQRLAYAFSGSGGQNPFVAAAAGSPQSVFFKGFVSDPLSAQIIPAQTHTFYYGMYTEGGALFKLALSVKIWRPSTGAIVGTIYDSATGIGSNTLSSNATYGKVTTFSGASVVVQDGDRMVLEWWAVGGNNDNIHFQYDGSGTPTEGGSGFGAQISFASPIYTLPQPLGMVRVGPTGISSSTSSPSITPVTVASDAEFRSKMVPTGSGSLWDATQTARNGSASPAVLEADAMAFNDLAVVDTVVQFTDRDTVVRNTLKVTIEPSPHAPASSANDSLAESSATPQARWALPAGIAPTSWIERQLWKFAPGFRLDCPNNTLSNKDWGNYTCTGGSVTTATVGGSPWVAGQLVNSLVTVPSGSGAVASNVIYIITANTTNSITFAQWQGSTPSVALDATSVVHVFGFNFNNSGAYKIGPHPSNGSTRSDLEITGGQNPGSEYLTGNFGSFCTTDNNYIVGAMATLMPGWNTGGDVWEFIRVMRDHGDNTATQAIYIGKVTDTYLTKVYSTTRTLNLAAQTSWPAMSEIGLIGKNFNRQLASTDTPPVLNVSDVQFADITEAGFAWPAQIQLADRI